MNETQGDVLRAIAETVVPRVERADDPGRLLGAPGRRASARTRRVAEAIAPMPEQQREGLGR